MPSKPSGASNEPKKRAPQGKPAQYRSKPGPKGPNQNSTDTPCTAAQPATKEQGENLTFGDWLHHVFPCTLSRNLKKRKELEACVEEFPNALSSKRVRHVTQPDIEEGVRIWFNSLMNRNEVVTGPMLVEKQKQLEEAAQVPQEERLTGTRSRNGVDTGKQLQQTQKMLLARELAYRLCWNCLYMYKQPNQGLADHDLSGKKKNKAWISILLAANADGSEKLEPLFIVKSAKPRCFKKKTGTQLGFNYKHNKKAWMTQAIFELWLQKVNAQMQEQGRKIVLLLDNFSGHYVDYQPKNITIIFFAPNLTAWVQPMDGGPIRCFKAHYCCGYCWRALDNDKACNGDGSIDIWAMNQLEAMIMAKEVWIKGVSNSTIANCYRHIGILLRRSGSSPTCANLEAGWLVLWEFAQDSGMTLPMAEEKLSTVLKDQSSLKAWEVPLKAVMNAEGDVTKALAQLTLLKSCRTLSTAPDAPILSPSPPSPGTGPDLHWLELKSLLEATMDEFKTQSHIGGHVHTVNKFLAPEGEDEDLDNKQDKAVIDMTDVRLMEIAQEKLAGTGNAPEEEGMVEGESAEEIEPTLPISELMAMARQLKAACLVSDAELLHQLMKHLPKWRVEMGCAQVMNAKQSSLNDYFKCS